MRAEYVPIFRRHVRRGRAVPRCIRIDMTPPDADTYPRGKLLTLAEARELLESLPAAIRAAEANEPRYPAPEPPLAGAAALEAA